MPSGLGAALYMGTCSGHGKGSGSTAHPGHVGGMLSPCPHTPMRPDMGQVPIAAQEPVTLWPPVAQLPAGPAVTNVLINKKVPIVDQDELTPHPTPTLHVTTSTGYKCLTTLSTPAWWLTDLGGARETAAGHPRKLVATTATVFVNKKRLGRFNDPFGVTPGTGPYGCLSKVAGSSPNVFVGA